MAAVRSRHIALAEPLMAFVDDRVAEGRYAFASEVTRAPLRLLIGPEKDRSRPGRKAIPNRE